MRRRGAAAALVERIKTAFVTRDLARHMHVPMPIVDGLAAVLSRKLTIDAAIEGLMARPFRREAG